MVQNVVNLGGRDNNRVIVILGGGTITGRGRHCLRSSDATILCFEPIMRADAQIGFFRNETDVPESSGVVMLTVGVLAGELEEMVNISFSTDSSSAIGRCM